ncbi:MAG: 16S rRNA (uracil(1498)-N(3))-methyltransferase [Bdellovibrionales bacterium]|nr:16S rRNA (uracil(1498)-N(3))-methyltransferase [Bdellovibrionales bacterium]
MNILLFEEHEVSAEGILTVCGDRARHMIDVQRMEVGQRVRIGALGGKQGSGRIAALSPDRVEIRIEALDAEVPAATTDLIVALPRPQILKKILSMAAALGVRRIMLVRSARVIKSYFDSPALAPDKINQQLMLGLEQAIATHLPEVTIHERFRPFIEDALPGIAKETDVSLLAHPAATCDICELGLVERLGARSTVALAIGPEGGWEQHEVEAFERVGFMACSSGRHVLRVDTAVGVLLGQVEMLRRLPSASE